VRIRAVLSWTILLFQKIFAVFSPAKRASDNSVIDLKLVYRQDSERGLHRFRVSYIGREARLASILLIQVLV
jgi:hypothetical protein